MGTATSTAFGYVVAMETLFEKFVEATVLRATGLLPPNINASARSQVSTIFAQPQNGGRRPYYTRPDNVVSLDAKPAIIIDAKYKRFADAETGGSGRPSNADIYQMFAAMAAQECRLAVLVYPSIRDLEGPIPIWKTRIGGEEAFVAATAIQISDLRTAEDVRSVDKRLAAALQLLLYKAYGPTIHVAA
jgi:5-methylcytosine-specific restriction endonuclease McrBC regulatory subunit McrC